MRCSGRFAERIEPTPDDTNTNTNADKNTTPTTEEIHIMNTTPSFTFTGITSHYDPLNILLRDPMDEGKKKTLSELELRAAFIISEAVKAEWTQSIRTVMKTDLLTTIEAAKRFAAAHKRSSVSDIAQEAEKGRNKVSYRPMLWPVMRWDDPFGAGISYAIEPGGRSVLITGRVKGESLTLPLNREGIEPRAALWTAWIDTMTGNTMLSVMPATAHKDEIYLEDWWQPLNRVLIAWGHPTRAAPRRKLKPGAQ